MSLPRLMSCRANLIQPSSNNGIGFDASSALTINFDITVFEISDLILQLNLEGKVKYSKSHSD